MESVDEINLPVLYFHEVKPRDTKLKREPPRNSSAIRCVSSVWELPYSTPHHTNMEGFWNGASSDGSSETMDSTHFSVTPNESHRTSSSETPTNEDSRVKKRGRKGHTKSRAGCFNCKKARIKVGHSRHSGTT